ncbi:MAG: hypothetical protein HQK86_01540 [Nitrospinae bacterium]|nr:hypothetical protein [Nitrospinota bacterium]
MFFQTQLIYLADYFPDTLVFFYFKGKMEKSTSFSIRDYSTGGKARIYRGKDFPGKTAADILRMATAMYDARRLATADTPSYPTDDVHYWRSRISEVNQRHGLRPL